MAQQADPTTLPADPTATASAGPAFAALDLGTNNCRLLIGTPATGGFRVIDSFSRVVRLGEGLQSSGELCAAAMDRAIAALHACAERLGRRPVREMRAIATEACRRAGNGRVFLDRVRRETGLAFDIISTREEAQLALASCAPLLDALVRGGARRALLLDIGGGSTELAWVRLDAAAEPQLIGTVSLPIGVIDVAEAWGGAAVGAGGFDATVAALARQFRDFDAVHCIAHEIRQGGVALVGTSGTVTTLAGVALDLPRYRRALVDGVMLDAAMAQAAVARLRAMGTGGLAAHPCIGPDRAEFALPGCAIFAAIHRVWPADRIMVADRGLREGMLLRMMRDDASRPSRPRRPRPSACAAPPP
jgi:exopolyphosphatase/guanosine-5'-triphosphate,3'-diphosphate pyrophosphatase